MKSVLVVCLDAKLRNALFGLVSQRGFRVDAVGDAIALAKRLSKDEYAFVVLEKDVIDVPTLPDTTTIIEVSAELDRSQLEERLIKME